MSSNSYDHILHRTGNSAHEFVVYKTSVLLMTSQPKTEAFASYKVTLAASCLSWFQVQHGQIFSVSPTSPGVGIVLKWGRDLAQTWFIRPPVW